LAHALMLPNVPALGMLVMGCCPSGSTSNVFSYWVDGDVALRYNHQIRRNSTFRNSIKNYNVIVLYLYY
jgi:hypothetical protein